MLSCVEVNRVKRLWNSVPFYHLVVVFSRGSKLQTLVIVCQQIPPLVPRVCVWTKHVQPGAAGPRRRSDVQTAGGLEEIQLPRCLLSCELPHTTPNAPRCRSSEPGAAGSQPAPCCAPSCRLHPSAVTMKPPAPHAAKTALMCGDQ